MFLIITITMNNLAGLARTIDSVEKQDICRKRYRLIVIDGCSTDGTKEYLRYKKQQDSIDEYVSEKDTGVYNAMNKGIALSKPADEYVLFLNAGDSFCNSSVLSETERFISSDNKKSLVYYGDKLDSDGNVNKAYYPSSLTLGIINACHQSYFYKLLNIYYDENYRLFSDYDFTCKYYKVMPFTYLGFPVSIYEDFGLSSHHSWKTKKEIYIINLKHFGLINFCKFIFVKVLSALGISHKHFMKKH